MDEIVFSAKHCDSFSRCVARSEGILKLSMLDLIKLTGTQLQMKMEDDQWCAVDKAMVLRIHDEVASNKRKSKLAECSLLSLVMNLISFL